MTRLNFIELHNDLFHAGKNHGKKLFHKEGKELFYNDKKGWFEVSYNNRIAKIPMSAVQSWEDELLFLEAVVVASPSPMDTRRIKSAQVSTPMGHVFEGEGHGKKNDRA